MSDGGFIERSYDPLTDIHTFRVKCNLHDDMEKQVVEFFNQLKDEERDRVLEEHGYFKRKTCGAHRTYLPISPWNTDVLEPYELADFYCEHCNTDLDEDWRFCPECGSVIEGGARL